MLKELSQAETLEQLDLRGIETPSLESFAYLDRDVNIRYDWHAHDRHQLMYAFSGTLRLEAENGVYLLPPQRAAWIPARVPHRTTLHNVRSGSVFFAPHLVPTELSGVRIISAAPIVREMVKYSLRWPPTRDPADRLANAFFRTLGMLCVEWIQEEMPFRLPAAFRPLLAHDVVARGAQRFLVARRIVFSRLLAALCIERPVERAARHPSGGPAGHRPVGLH